MKYIKKILFVLTIFLLGIGNINAKEKNLVNIYLFYSNTCPHCKAANEALEGLKKKHDNIRVYKYEISSEENTNKLVQVSELLNFKITGVPITIIGEKIYHGYNSETGYKSFDGAINYYTEYGYRDKIGELFETALPNYKVDKNQISIDDYLENYDNFVIKVPFIGKISTKNLTIPVVAIIIGLLDGFNPCAMWILLFLISMLIGMKNKFRMWTLGLTFIFTSALIYLFFMLSWLNVTSVLSSIPLFKIAVGLIALLGGTINIVSYFKHRKDDGCNVTTMKKRKQIMTRIKKFTTEKSLLLAILGIVALAISVNIIELACSAGLPVMFIQILNINHLSTLEYSFNIILYIIMFMLDDIIVFIIAIRTLQLTGISTKYGKLTKIIGGIILLLIGILMIFKPEWLMFNF